MLYYTDWAFTQFLFSGMSAFAFVLFFIFAGKVNMFFVYMILIAFVILLCFLLCNLRRFVSKLRLILRWFDKCDSTLRETYFTQQPVMSVIWVRHGKKYSYLIINIPQQLKMNVKYVNYTWSVKTVSRNFMLFSIIRQCRYCIIKKLLSLYR